MPTTSDHWRTMIIQQGRGQIWMIVEKLLENVIQKDLDGQKLPDQGYNIYNYLSGASPSVDA